MHLIAVLQQVVRRLADADVGFDAAEHHLLDMTLAQLGIKFLHAASGKRQLLDRLRSRRNMRGEFGDGAAQAFGILFGDENRQVPQRASLHHQRNAGRQDIEIRDGRTKGVLHIDHGQRRAVPIQQRQ